jgi:hypothetical protein
MWDRSSDAVICSVRQVAPSSAQRALGALVPNRTNQDGANTAQPEVQDDAMPAGLSTRRRVFVSSMIVARSLRVHVVAREQHDDPEHSHRDEKHANDCYAAGIKADEFAPAYA